MSSMSLVEESWLRANVNESDSLAAVKVAFTALAEGTVTQPPVMQLQFAQTGGETCIKSAFLGGRPIAAVKIASGFYNNPQREPPLPSGSGVIIVLDASTGLPLALLSDGGFLTDMRTGAAGALAVELLAPRRKLKKIAIIGAGAQARFQLKALSQVRDWDVVEAYSRDAVHLATYIAEMRDSFPGRTVRAAPNAESCVRGAELVVSTTPSKVAIVKADWLSAGVTVIAMGSDTPGKQELEDAVLVIADKLICDSEAQCRRLGELQHLGSKPVHAELGQVLTEQRSGRMSESEIIVVDLTGCGAQDAAIAEFAFAKFKSKSML